MELNFKIKNNLDKQQEITLFGKYARLKYNKIYKDVTITYDKKTKRTLWDFYKSCLTDSLIVKISSSKEKIVKNKIFYNGNIIYQEYYLNDTKFMTRAVIVNCYDNNQNLSFNLNPSEEVDIKLSDEI